MQKIKPRRRLSVNPDSRKGFTLVELFVALAAASILSASALQLYGHFHHLTLHFIQDYQQESFELMQQMRQVNPYKRKIPGLRARD